MYTEPRILACAWSGDSGSSTSPCCARYCHYGGSGYYYSRGHPAILSCTSRGTCINGISPASPSVRPYACTCHGGCSNLLSDFSLTFPDLTWHGFLANKSFHACTL